MGITRYIIKNRITDIEQSVSEEDWKAIQANPRMASQWYVSQKLEDAITKNIPPAGITINNDAKEAAEKLIKPLTDMTLDELKAECDFRNIKYKKTAKEADLLTLLGLE